MVLFSNINRLYGMITDKIQIPQNKLCFMLMLEYFKCTNKFYTNNFLEKAKKALVRAEINDADHAEKLPSHESFADKIEQRRDPSSSVQR